MSSKTSVGFFALLAVVTAAAGCWRSNVYAITDESAGRDAATEPAVPDAATEPAVPDVATEPAVPDVATEPVVEDAATDPAEDEGPPEPQGRDAAAEPPRNDAPTEPPRNDAPVDMATETVPCPSPTLQSGDTSITLQVGTQTRTYVLHVPPKYDGKKPGPLIVDFHGIGSTGWGELSSSPYPDVTDPEGVVIAFPDGVKGPAGTGWNVGPCCVDKSYDDVAFARAVVADVRESACIDPARVYAVGVLTGGGMAHYLACHAADVFAAVAPAAFDLLKENADGCNPSRPITVISFRGNGTSRVPYEGGASSLVPGMSITFLGAIATFQKWAELDGCTGSPSGEDGKGCSSYPSCRDGVEVTLCTKQGGGVDPADATVAWPVLKRHTLPL